MELEILVFSYITVEINEFSYATFYCNSYLYHGSARKSSLWGYNSQSIYYYIHLTKGHPNYLHTHSTWLTRMSEHSRFVFIICHVTLHVKSNAEKVNLLSVKIGTAMQLRLAAGFWLRARWKLFSVYVVSIFLHFTLVLFNLYLEVPSFHLHGFYISLTQSGPLFHLYGFNRVSNIAFPDFL